MDSQHRHELHQNDLRKLADKATPFVEKYVKEIVGVAGALVVIFIAGAWWYSQSSAGTAESWTQLDRVLHQQNPSVVDFAAIAEKNPGTTAAAWARLKEAEEYFKTGLQAIFSNREAALADLKSAQEAFQKLSAGGPGITPEIQERALFDLARCLETVSDGSDDAALDAYRQLVIKFPKTMFLAYVNDRIKALESPSSKEFYAWFHQQKAKPEDPFVHGFKPREDGSSNEGEIDPDEKMELETGSGEKSDSTDEPKSDEDKPKEEAQPDAESKSDEKPAEEKKPTDGTDKSDTPKTP